MGYGLDCYDRIFNIPAEKVNWWGSPYFWVRYGDTGNMYDPVQEMRSAWDYGTRYLGLVWPQTPSSIYGSYDDGYNDGITFCNNARWFYQTVGPLVFTDSQRLFLYADQEPWQATSGPWWSGFWVAIYNFAFSPGFAPFWPGLYCDPSNPIPNCSLDPTPTAIWSNHPVLCGACAPFTQEPNISPNTCGGSPPVIMYQYMIAEGCSQCQGYNSLLDADLSYAYDSSYFGEGINNMYLLAYRP